MARNQDRRQPGHSGRTTAPSDDVYVRQRSKTVTLVAWTIVAGMSLAVVLPVLALLFG